MRHCRILALPGYLAASLSIAGTPPRRSITPSICVEPADRNRYAEPVDRFAVGGLLNLEGRNPEDAPLHVEDGTAAVARVDRRIQLNQTVRINLAHDAGRGRASQAEGRADDHHALADLRRASVLNRYQIEERFYRRSVELEDRKILADVFFHHFSLVALAVLRLDLHKRCISNDVGVGHEQPTRKDETGAEHVALDGDDTTNVFFVDAGGRLGSGRSKCDCERCEEGERQRQPDPPC